jgi:hypothetical protein
MKQMIQDEMFINGIQEKNDEDLNEQSNQEIIIE